MTELENLYQATIANRCTVIVSFAGEKFRVSMYAKGTQMLSRNGDVLSEALREAVGAWACER